MVMRYSEMVTGDKFQINKSLYVASLTVSLSVCLSVLLSVCLFLKGLKNAVLVNQRMLWLWQSRCLQSQKGLYAHLSCKFQRPNCKWLTKGEEQQNAKYFYFTGHVDSMFISYVFHRSFICLSCKFQIANCLPREKWKHIFISQDIMFIFAATGHLRIPLLVTSLNTSLNGVFKLATCIVVIVVHECTITWHLCPPLENFPHIILFFSRRTSLMGNGVCKLGACIVHCSGPWVYYYPALY